MFIPYYEVHIKAKACESENITTGFLHFDELSAVTEFIDLANEYYVFDSVEVYRCYKNDMKDGGCYSCRVENM